MFKDRDRILQSQAVERSTAFLSLINRKTRKKNVVLVVQSFLVNISSIIFRYDPHATQFINFSQLSDFIASLDSPLGIPKPNILALVSFDLPIAKGDKIHCLDVLHSLTKYTLGFVDDGDEDFGKVSFFSLALKYQSNTKKVVVYRAVWIQ